MGNDWNVCELQGNEDKASEFPKTGPVVQEEQNDGRKRIKSYHLKNILFWVAVSG